MIAILAVPYENRHYMNIFKATILAEAGLISDIVNVVLLKLLELKNKWTAGFLDNVGNKYYGLDYYDIEHKTSYKSITPLDLIPSDRIKKIADKELLNYKPVIVYGDSHNLKISYGVYIHHIEDERYDAISKALKEKKVFSLDDQFLGLIIYDSKDNIELNQLIKTYYIEDYYKYDSDIDDLIDCFKLTINSQPVLELITY